MNSNSTFSVAAALHHHLEPTLQRIEVWSSMAVPSFRVVGLPGPEIIESCERVRAAIEHSGYEFPRRRILVNLSPAGIRKQGTGTDLAIALGILQPSGLNGVVASGELGLDGRITSAGKVLRTCLAAIDARASQLLLAREDRDRAIEAYALIREARSELHSLPALKFAASLHEAVQALSHPEADQADQQLSPRLSPPSSRPEGMLVPEATLFRKLLACSAGAHSLLLLGPKGTGKTAALEWLRFLRRELSASDILGQLKLQELLPLPQWDQRAPVREVSPQARAETLLGGIHRGVVVPGELALAHGGLLFADEFLEWRRDARECLRDPLESGRILLQRAQQCVILPARFILCATANLCPCGGTPSEFEGPNPCRCSPRLRQAYLERLSGPILDRIDCVSWIQSTPSRGTAKTCDLDQARDQVEKCRARLKNLWGKLPGELNSSELEDLIQQEPKLNALQAKWGSSPCSLRRRHREIRLALSLAAMDLESLPGPHHWREASPPPIEAFKSSLRETPIQFLNVSKRTPAPTGLTPWVPTP